jgi:hypothetical protein
VACNLNLKAGAYENQKKPAVVLNQFMKSAWILFLRMLVPGPNMLYHFCPQFVLRTIYELLVWTLCLMHRCVCIWLYILQNYNYKLHFQNLSIYHIPHVAIGTMAAENLDVCSACDPWDSNIQLTMGKDRRQQIYVGFAADIDIKKSCRCHPLGRACLP